MKLQGRVVSVGASGRHKFTKSPTLSIRLVAGLGVEGDAHAGVTVKHRSRVAKTPDAPNLRQAHIMHAELFDELREKGFSVGPGDLGENVTTQGVDILALPEGAIVRLGDTAVLKLTGLRNPCMQLDKFQKGLMAATLDRAPDGALIRKAGVMAVVVETGDVRAGDPIVVELPDGARKPLQPV